jgi:hypothetical protein
MVHSIKLKPHRTFNHEEHEEKNRMHEASKNERRTSNVESKYKEQPNHEEHEESQRLKPNYREHREKQDADYLRFTQIKFLEAENW